MRTNRQSHSGAIVATTFHRLLALIFLLAWLSLLWQIDVLIGSRGMMPLADFLDRSNGAAALEFATFPTVLLWNADDAVLKAGVWLGIAIALVWLIGRLPRACAIVSAFLYLSYATAARDFLHFQWDNMLIECGVLAAFLPADRPATWIHFLFRVLLFKLYFESGVAKWQSYLGDWHDGSAMTFYYETAPIPTWLAWYAHALPEWWHRLESRAVLAFELLVPMAIFAGRRARLSAAAVLTVFQLVNLATANYGFFCYLSLALHVFLLDDRDLTRAPCRPADAGQAFSRIPAPLRRVATLLLATTYIVLSFVEAVYAFAPPSYTPPAIAAARRSYAPFRIVNTYHLFGHITRERIEPEFQTFDGGEWQARHLRFKPGDPAAPPPFVAPHQPRVDFRLWFYGLSFRRETPAYVQSLVQRLCHDPAAVESLFAEPLPASPKAVRLVFWTYRFSREPDDASWWTRQPLAETRAIECRSIAGAG